MESRIRLRKKITPQGDFYYLLVGHEGHGRPSFILWVSQKLIQKDKEGNETIYFPIRGATIVTTEKGSRVLRASSPHEDRNVFDCIVSCGYRGESCIELLTPNVECYNYEYWHSERGSLGVSRGALVVTNAPVVTFKWAKTGRLYGKPGKGISTIDLSGQIVDLPEVPNGLQEVEEIKKLTE